MLGKRYKMYAKREYGKGKQTDAHADASTEMYLYHKNVYMCKQWSGIKDVATCFNSET